MLKLICANYTPVQKTACAELLNMYYPALIYTIYSISRRSAIKDLKNLYKGLRGKHIAS